MTDQPTPFPLPGPGAATEAAAAPRPGALRRFLHDPLGVGSAAVIVLLVLVALFAPLITGVDPTESRVADVLAPSGPGHPLGADGLGRDILAQLVHGARTGLLGALIAVAVIIAVGVPAGIVAGFYRNWFDAVSGWLANALMSLPAIIILLVVLARFGRSTYLAMVVFGLLLAPASYRLIRASVVGVREELYVDAARVSGLSDARIMRRHILPVVLAPTLIQAAQFVGVAIVIQAGIEYLGLGSEGQASWGAMLNDAQQNIFDKPGLLIWPGLAIVITVVAFSLFGNALRDALNPATPLLSARRRAAAQGAVAATTATHTADPSSPSAQQPLQAMKRTTDEDALLCVDGLRVSYARSHSEDALVVRDVSLSVSRGQILGLVGESGSGKTQTAFAILGLLPPNATVSARRMTFDGENLLDLSAAHRNRLRGRRIAYIPQEPSSNLDPNFTIGYQLVEPMRHHLRLSTSDCRTKALELLARVGIAEPERVFDSYPHQISGGMAQRVLIAGAVSCGPDLLIADEPTTALDVTVQAEVLDLLRDLRTDLGMGIILVTHNFGVVADLCDSVSVMRDGQIVESGKATDLFDRPQHEYTRMLLDSVLDDAPSRADLAATRQRESPSGATSADLSVSTAPIESRSPSGGQ